MIAPLKFICATAFLLLLCSCTKETITASDEITVRNYSFSDFSALDISDNFNVKVTFSDTEEEIQIEANDNLHRYISLQMEGNTLKIKLKDVRKIRGNETLNVYIATGSVTDFRASGNSKLVLENTLNTPEIKLDLVGNTWFTGYITTDLLILDSRGNCIVDLSGNAKNVKARLRGNCEFSDYALIVEKLKIDLSGNSNAYLTVNKSIDIVAKGNSVLSYKGDAIVEHQDLSSDSRIIKKQ